MDDVELEALKVRHRLLEYRSKLLKKSLEASKLFYMKEDEIIID